MSLFKKMFDFDEKELRRFEKIAKDIEALDEEYQKLSDEDLKKKKCLIYTFSFKLS